MSDGQYPLPTDPRSAPLPEPTDSPTHPYFEVPGIPARYPEGNWNQQSLRPYYPAEPSPPLDHLRERRRRLAPYPTQALEKDRRTGQGGPDFHSIDQRPLETSRERRELQLLPTSVPAYSADRPRTSCGSWSGPGLPSASSLPSAPAYPTQLPPLREVGPSASDTVAPSSRHPMQPSAGGRSGEESAAPVAGASTRAQTAISNRFRYSKQMADVVPDADEKEIKLSRRREQNKVASRSFRARKRNEARQLEQRFDALYENTCVMTALTYQQLKLRRLQSTQPAATHSPQRELSDRSVDPPLTQDEQEYIAALQEIELLSEAILNGESDIDTSVIDQWLALINMSEDSYADPARLSPDAIAAETQKLQIANDQLRQEQATQQRRKEYADRQSRSE